MKSTLKIDFESRYNGGVPVIKIIQPEDALFEEQPDFDVRDKLIRDFLHSPCRLHRNDIFELATYDCSFGNPKLNLTTISAVSADDRFQRLRDWTRNTITDWKIPFDEKKIDILFDEICKAINNYKESISDLL